MSKLKISLLIILILGTIWGVLRHPQMQQYLPTAVKGVNSQISFDKIPTYQITNQLSLNNLSENQVTNWIKAKWPANAESVQSSLPESLPIDEVTSEELKTFSQRAVEVGAETKQVLGASIQPAEEGSAEAKPIYQTAIESGLYYYCRQVVNDYEKQRKIN